MKLQFDALLEGIIIANGKHIGIHDEELQQVHESLLEEVIV